MDFEDKRVITKGSNREHDILGKWVIPEWKMEIIAKGMTEIPLSEEEQNKIWEEYTHKVKDIKEEFNQAFGMGEHSAYMGYDPIIKDKS